MTEKIIKFEKRFPKDLYKIQEDEKDIVVVPKNPNVLYEAKKLLIAEGVDEKEIDDFFNSRPTGLIKYFKYIKRDPFNVFWNLDNIF